MDKKSRGEVLASRRLKPVSGGSIKTKSAVSKMLSGLSTAATFGSAIDWSVKGAMCTGPKAPKNRVEDEPPGPPLYTKRTGREVASLTSAVNAHVKADAAGLPSGPCTMVSATEE